MTLPLHYVAHESDYLFHKEDTVPFDLIIPVTNSPRYFSKNDLNMTWIKLGQTSINH